MDEKLLETENTPASEEDEGVIITIDDNDLGPDAEELQESVFAEINSRESHIEDYTPPKLGFFKTLENFWYRNKVLIITALVAVLVVGYLVVTSIPEEYDVTATVYVSYSDYATSITYEIQDEFEEYTLDWDGNGKSSVFVNDYNICDDGGMSSTAQYEIVCEHIYGEPETMVWIVEKDLFETMLSACGEEYFESFEGAPLWLEIKHVDLINECIEIGECPRLGICLVRLTEEMSEDEDLVKSYENGKLMLANLKASHPEMFESE